MDEKDELLEALSRLPGMYPERDAAERTRERCHAAMARRVSREESARGGRALGLLDAAAAVMLCLYLAGVFTEVVRLSGRQ